MLYVEAATGFGSVGNARFSNTALLCLVGVSFWPRKQGSAVVQRIEHGENKVCEEGVGLVHCERDTASGQRYSLCHLLSLERRFLTGFSILLEECCCQRPHR